MPSRHIAAPHSAKAQVPKRPARGRMLGASQGVAVATDASGAITTADAPVVQSLYLESIGRFAGTIAHDFNNLLFAIRCSAELIDEDLGTDGPVPPDLDASRRNVRAILEATELANRLVAQLLAFGRQRRISPTVRDLNAAIDSLEPTVHQVIGEGIRLVLKLDRDAGRLQADLGQLDQILVNLVENARDAMPDGGTLTIETGHVELDRRSAIEHVDAMPGPSVLLKVSDTGSGMDHATRERVFEPFFTTKDPATRTGLGLATVYWIVQQSGGHIRADSKRGHGSTFSVYFPRVMAMAE